jgi:hypothetical protein
MFRKEVLRLIQDDVSIEMLFFEVVSFGFLENRFIILMKIDLYYSYLNASMGSRLAALYAG